LLPVTPPGARDGGATNTGNEESPATMWTIGLLTISNVFMTFAWYGHLRFREVPLWQVTLASWGIALFEYMLMVPANRLGAQSGWNGFELKITQEVITLSVFTVFALTYLRERLQWNYAVAFLLLIAAVFFTFGFRKA
jgi:uncharacterized protein